MLPPDHAFPEPQPQRTRARLDDPELAHLVAEEADQLLGFTVCGASRDEDSNSDTGRYIPSSFPPNLGVEASAEG